MDASIVLWLYLLSAILSGWTMLGKRSSFRPRAFVILLVLAVVSAAGISRPDWRAVALWVSTPVFVLGLMAPGLAIQLGRSAARRGRFRTAHFLLSATYLLLPATFLVDERDFYGRMGELGPDHPLVHEFRARAEVHSRRVFYPTTTAVVVAIVVMFFIEMAVGNSESMLTLLELGANYRPFVVGGQYFRLITAMALHVGWLHLGMNAFAIWIVGRWLEPEVGAAKTWIVFIVGGIAGNLLSLFLAGHHLPYAVAAGASGGGMALIGGAAIVLLHRPQAPMRRERLQALALIAGATIFLGVVVKGIDNGAHLGGLATGALLALWFVKFPTLDRRFVRAAAFLLLILTAGAFAQMARQASSFARTEQFSSADFSLALPRFVSPYRQKDGWLFDGGPVGELAVNVYRSKHPAADASQQASSIVKEWARVKNVEAHVEGPTPTPLHEGAMKGVTDLAKLGRRIVFYTIPEVGGDRLAVLKFQFDVPAPVFEGRLIPEIVKSFQYSGSNADDRR